MNSGSDPREDEAARWLARMASGDYRSVEKAEFEAWLNDAANAQALERVKAAASLADEPAMEILAEMFEAELEELSARSSRKRTGFMAIAAMAPFMLAVMIAFNLSGLPQRDNLDEYRTAIGQSVRAETPDGSIIHLNTDSEVTFEEGRDQRTAKLARGEALFNVRHNPAKPFIVIARDAEITVMGTVFNVAQKGDMSHIGVLSGAVTVKPAAANPLTLIAGQSVMVNEAGFASAISAFDPNIALSWREGRLRFRDTPLSDVVTELNRYFPEEILLGDESLRDLPVTGDFQVDNMEAVLSALGVAFPLSASHSPNGMLLLPREEAQE